MLAMRSARSVMRSRLLTTWVRSPRCANIFALAMKVRIAASGWLISCASAADICPSAASLPACTSSFWVVRSRASVWRCSSISVCSEAFELAEIARALLNLCLELRRRGFLDHVGPVPLDHVKHERR